MSLALHSSPADKDGRKLGMMKAILKQSNTKPSVGFPIIE